ncbi:MAG: response regulator [Francisellaceae bacterium]|nr:response regulator [Francisellaceae bacterium]MBT6539047.1 response regulator [Francisellaceae bacterium]
MKSKKNILSKWGFKQQVLCLALIPPITISLLLGVYFISIRLGELSNALHDRGNAVATRLASQGEYGLFAGDASALRRLAQREISNEVSSVAFYDKDGIEVASAGNLTSSLEPPKVISDVHVIVNNETNDVLSFVTPVTLPEVIIDDDFDSVKLLGDNHLRATIIGWLKVEVERRATKLKSYQVFIQSCMIVFLGVCMSFLLAMRLDNKVSTPILSLIQAVKKIKNGRFKTRVSVSSNWELQILQSGVNMMASSLESSHIEMQNNIDQATSDLRKTLETIEIQNIELEEARNKAEAASKVKSEFLANMSHELRTPLNAITGFVGLVKKTNLNEQQYDYLKTIEESSTSLVSIINDILDFSKFEAGKVKMFYETINLRECIEETLAMLAPSAHEKDLELINFMYNDVPELVVSDRLRLKQVITNLVNNAIKFTHKGSVVLRAMVEQASEHEIDLCISISDTGIGLTKDQQNQIFHAFSQANPNITRKFGGTGLGLVICKKIISQMDGEISLNSIPHHGSTFWFTIPVKVAKSSETAEIIEFNEYANKKFLVFDRNKIHRTVISNTLNHWGFNCAEIDSLDDVITYLKKIEDIDTVILSVNNAAIADHGCQQTISLIKQMNKKVLLMANTTDHSVHGDFLNWGVDCSVAKPVSKKKFAKVLHDIFGDNMNHGVRGKDIRVLAVDDNFANMKLLTVLLKSMGSNVITANNGQKAVDMCRDNEFDVIFMDINMPVMDGIKASSLLRTEAGLNQNTPIIALSAHIQSEDREAFLGLGINDTITKPILEHELKAILYKWSYSEMIMKDRKEQKSITNFPKNNAKAIDWDISLKLANHNADLAKDMLDMLCTSLPDELKEINKLFISENYQMLYDVVHRLHGGCCYCGVTALKESLTILDKSLLSKKYSGLEIKINDTKNKATAVLEEYNKNYVAKQLSAKS